MSRVVADMARGVIPLALRTVAELPQTNATGYLAALLMDSGTVPPENFDRVRMEVWEQQHCASIEDREIRNLLRQYSSWVINPRFDEPARNGSVLESSRLSRSKSHLLAVTDFLLSIRGLGFTIRTVPQRVFDAHVAETGRAGVELTRFIRWAKERGFTRLESVYSKTGLNPPSITDELRWTWVKSLLNEEGSLTAAARVAGLFCLLFGIKMTKVISLRRDDVSCDGGRVLVFLGVDGVELPLPMANLVKTLMDQHATSSRASSPWLFPGKLPGRHLTSTALVVPLRKAGIHLRQGKGSALMSLSQQVPPSVLADLLGISLAAATRWATLSAHDWTEYPRLRMTDVEAKGPSLGSQLVKQPSP